MCVCMYTTVSKHFKAIHSFKTIFLKTDLCERVILNERCIQLMLSIFFVNTYVLST